MSASGRKVFVLRLGHRVGRDKRLTMHVLLTSRAFSANGAIYSGERDKELEMRIKSIVDRWGGVFEVTYERSWKKIIDDWRKRGVVCHLTMYGVNIDDCVHRIPRDKDILAIVGSEKVPGILYKLSDYNISVGSQPHSEVAALAIFLDRLFGGEELKRSFEGFRIKVEPQERGKKVTNSTRLNA